jgi:hypothetical protein
MLPSGSIMWGSVPVPYTAFWSEELPVRSWSIRRVRELGGYAFIVEDDSNPGAGKPKLSTFHTGRAVEVLVKGICQICRGKLVTGDLWCIGFGQTFKYLPHITDGLPMCGACTKLALHHCPTLRERMGTTLRLYAVSDFNLCPPVMGERDPRDGGDPNVNLALRRWTGPRPVFGCPKIVLTAFRVVDTREFLA